MSDRPEYEPEMIPDGIGGSMGLFCIILIVGYVLYFILQ
jgi:hypothetical protein